MSQHRGGDLVSKPISSGTDEETRPSLKIPDNDSSVKFNMKLKGIQQRIPPVFFGYLVLVVLINFGWIEKQYTLTYIGLCVFDITSNVIASAVVLMRSKFVAVEILELAYFGKTLANAMVRVAMQIYLGREVPIWMLNFYSLLSVTHTSYFRKQVGFLNFLVVVIANTYGQYVAFSICKEEFENGGRFFTLTNMEKQTPYNYHNIWDSGEENRIKLVEPIIACAMVMFIGHVFEGLVEQQYDDTINSRIALSNQKELNKSKSKFISNLSHELRNPLHGLLVTVELLQLEIKKIADSLVNFDYLKPKSVVEALENGVQYQFELLNDIQSNSKVLMDVFSNSLQVCNLELGKIKLNISPFNILELTDSIMSVFSNLAQEKGLLLQTIVDVKNVPWYLKGDHVRLSQVLINCMSNSVKYTKTGQVVLKCTLCNPADEDYPFSSEIMLGEDEQEIVCLRITCRDTGIGIPTNEIGKLFQPFHTVDGVSSSIDFERYYSESIVTGGDSFHERHGLGLSISNQFIELMKGKIRVESEINVGTKMSIYLPLIKCNPIEFPTSNRIFCYLKEIMESNIGRILILEQDEALSNTLENLCSAIFPNSTCVSVNDERSLNELLDTLTMGVDYSFRDIVFYSKSKFPDDVVSALENSILIPTAKRGDPFCQSVKGIVCLPARMEQFISVMHSVLFSKDSSLHIPKSNSDQFSVFHTKRVLVVDDNDVNRKVLQKMTNILGFESKVACDGLQAFELFKKEHFDLVLLDLLMPVLSGKECCKLIRSIPSGKECKVVAVTANIWESTESLIGAGFDHVLKKPISMADLRKELQGLLC